MFDVRPENAGPLAGFVLLNGLLVSTLASLVSDPRVMQVCAGVRLPRTSLFFCLSRSIRRTCIKARHGTGGPDQTAEYHASYTHQSSPQPLSRSDMTLSC